MLYLGSSGQAYGQCMAGIVIINYVFGVFFYEHQPYFFKEGVKSEAMS